MTPTKLKLWDSVSLTSIRTGKFKTGMLSLSLSLPLTKTNSAHNALISGVMRRGTQKYKNAAELNRALDELYAATVEFKSSRCGKLCLLTLSAEMLDNAYVADGIDVLDGVSEILSEMLLYPKTENGIFTEDAVKKEKAHVIDAIKAEINNPRAYASDRCAELLHRNDGDFATLEDMLSEVESTTAASLYGYYQKLLSSSSLNIYYVGSEPIEKVSEIIKRRFGKFCGKCSCTPTLSVEPYLEPIEKTEKMSVSQGKLCLGFRTGVCASDKEYFATALLNEIFGGSPASKLFMNVREKMSLCYYCASRYDSFMGNLTVSAGINVSDRELAYGAILNQLEDIKNGKISNEEMTAAKKAVAHSFRQIYDYPFELVAFYRNKELFGIKATPEGYAERFAQVTLDDIVLAAKKVRLDSVFFLEGTLDGYDEEENDD